MSSIALFIIVILTLLSSTRSDGGISVSGPLTNAIALISNTLEATHKQFLRATTSEVLEADESFQLKEVAEQEALLQFVKDLPSPDSISYRRRLDSSNSSSCNLTAYTIWANQLYNGQLAGDSSFWIYQTQPQIYLTNYLALQLAVRDCTRMLTSLTTGRSGKMGPVTIQDSYKIMCKSYCLQSDIIHEDAMSVSGCTCLELSTQPSDSAYTSSGDWCAHNSARLLCSTHGYCGVWGCAEDDFMCPRYEWNKKYIPYKGFGTCIRGAAASSRLTTLSTVLVMTLVTVLWSVWW